MKNAVFSLRAGRHGRVNRELKQQRRRRLRKRHLKSEFVLLQTLSRLFHLVYFVKILANPFLSWILEDCMYQSSGNEKEGCCLFFPSSTKREIWHFHVVVVQRRQEMYKKSMMHKVLFDQSKPIAFLPFSLPSPSSLRKLPTMTATATGTAKKREV